MSLHPPLARGAMGGRGAGPRRWLGHQRRRWLVLPAVVIAAAGGVAGWRLSQGGTVSAAHVYQVPVKPAPGFTLTDQSGRTLALSSLRGKAVAVYFMDPRCTDVCPLVAQEFIQADHELGALASRVQLIGVDVNPGYTARRWLTAFDAEHGLNRLANWHFVTGTVAQLRQVWENYGIQVQVTKTGDVVHTTVIDFIGPHGRLHGMAAPYALVRHNGTGYLPPGQLGQWATHIAAELRLLATPTGGQRP
jgi:protein SCO1/2